MAHRVGILPLMLETTNVTRQIWTFPPDLQGFKPLFEGPNAPEPPWIAYYRFGHDAEYDAIAAQGYVPEISMAIYKSLLKMCGIILSAEVKTNSKTMSHTNVANRITLVPVDQQIKLGTIFKMKKLATEITTITMHDFIQSEEGVRPFEAYDIMVLHPNEFVEIMATAVEGITGHGAHAIASCVGVEPLQILPPKMLKQPAPDGTHSFVDRRRALACTKSAILRFKTPSHTRPGSLLLRALRELHMYMRQLEKMHAHEIESGIYNISIPGGIGSAGATLLLARVVYIHSPEIAYIAPAANDELVIRMRGKSSIDCVDRIARAAKAVAAGIEILIDTLLQSTT